MGSHEKYLYNAIKILWLVSLVIICELFVPFGVFILPIFLLHTIIGYCAPLVNPKYGPVLSGMSSVAASDDLYNKPLYSVLLYYFVDGFLDIDEHRKLFWDNVVNARHEKSDKLKYPELRMHISQLCGFSIWKADETFDIKNHVRLHDTSLFGLKNGQRLDEDAVVAAANDILCTPFEKERSPWEIMVFHGAATKMCASKSQSLIVFRYHHSLSDGYSITKLMAQVTTGDYFPSPVLRKPEWKRWVEILTFPFTGMFVVVAYLHQYFDSNVWNFRVDSQAEKARDMHYFCSQCIPVQKIKEAKNKLGGSFNGVILAAIAGGIREHFVVNGAPMPHSMHVGLSFPVPGHPDQKLTNHWTAAIMRLPLGLSSPLKRLEFIQKQFKAFETMIVAQMPYLGSIYGGMLFRPVIAWILTNILKGTTCSMSIFPGPENLQFLSGEKITSGGFLLGPLANQGVSLTVVSYNGGLRVFLGAEKKIMAPEDTKKTVEYIADQLVNYTLKN